MRGLMPLVLAAAIALTALVALAWVFQRRLMYFPVDEVPAPAAVGLQAVETIRFPTADGLELQGWLVQARQTSRATIIVFNGNGANRAYRAPLAAALQARGFDVLLFDYRGYGGNPGAPTEAGLAEDARAARAYVATRRDAASGPIVYFGESLGAAVATTLAVEEPPAALILRSPFTSMADMAALHYSYLPARRVLRDRFETINRIGHVRVPLLVVAGDGDGIVPAEYSRQVFEAAAQPKTFALIRGADHNDDALTAGPEVIAAVVQFLEETLRVPPAS